uniref:Nudix hydrolase domain-containing protein n=2 Tax=Panagrellus redivivus TaxID=6233 RepID=A0A7E4VDU2_PANRE
MRVLSDPMPWGKCKWVRIIDNIAYIVGGIILREPEEGHLQVLLIQEAKKKAYGKWYFPAGHVEAGESIEEATKREVLEETGFNCSVDHLLGLEVRGSGWYRFSFFCSITGGELKTKEDKHSLGADWHSVEAVRSKAIELRAKDFIKIVDEAVKYYQWKNKLGPAVADFPKVLNVNENEKGLFVEFVIVKLGNSTNTTEVLVHQDVHTQEDLLTRDDLFPTVEFGFEYFFPVMVAKCYKHILVDGATALDPPSAVISTTCLPAPLESFQHGLRTRVLCYHKRTFTKSPLVDPRRYHWLDITDERVLASLCLVPGQFQPKLFQL